MAKTFVVVATYNEKENIERLVREIFALKIIDLEIIIVDDNSPDGTGQIAEELKKEFPLRIIHRAGKLGLGSALIAGFELALANGAGNIITLDADFSHSPQDIPRLLSAVNSGFDLAIGSRKIRGGKIIGWSPWRHFCSTGAMWLSRLALGMKTHDVTTNFRCYQKKVLETIGYQNIKSNGYSFMEEVVYLAERSGFKIKEVPVTFLDRKEGRSKLSRKEIINFFITIFRLRFLS